METVFQIHDTEPQGDILVFLTGREDIEIALEKITTKANKYN